MNVPVSFLQAATDPNLLGDPPLWEGQRPLYEWVDKGIRDGVEELVICCGRQVGKSELAVRLAIWQCLFRPDLDALMAGGRSYALILATDRQQARDILRRAVGRARSSPLVEQLVESDTVDELRFTNGTVLMAAATDSASVRGRSYRMLHFDEIGHLLDAGTSSGGDVEEIVRAAIPGTVAFGGKALRCLTSTPYGVDSWFGRRVLAAEKGELGSTALFTATTEAVNPNVSKDFLRQAEQDDPLGFASEYLGQLTGSGGQLIPDEAIEAAIVSETELDPSQGTGWIGGLDVGFTRDPFAAVVVGRDNDDHRRLLVGAVRRWDPPRDKPATATARRLLQDRVLGEVAALFARFGVYRCAFDGYEGPLVREVLRGVELEQLTMTAGVRLETFSAVRGRLQTGTLGLIRHQTLLDELRRVRTSSKGGSVQIHLPRSSAGHFDLCVALALSVWLADRENPPGKGEPLLVEVDTGPLYGRSTSVFGSDTARYHNGTRDIRRRVF